MTHMGKEQNDDPTCEPSQQTKSVPRQCETAERRRNDAAHEKRGRSNRPPRAGAAQFDGAGGKEILPQRDKIKSIASEVNLQCQRTQDAAGYSSGIDQDWRQEDKTSFNSAACHDGPAG
jgi:hypothetical protein